MNIELESMQQLLLWRLAVTEEGEFLKDIKTSLTSTKRKTLIREGFISESPRKHPATGRKAAFLTLEDRGWSWCQEHLADGVESKSPQTTVILDRLLKLVASFLTCQNETQSFGQFVLRARGARSIAGDVAPVGNPAPSALSREEAIRAACRDLGNGQHNVRVRLAALRSRLDLPREVLDTTLLSMEREGELSLYPLDDPQEIGPEDRAAALKIATGHERHIVYFEGPR